MPLSEIQGGRTWQLGRRRYSCNNSWVEKQCQPSSNWRSQQIANWNSTVQQLPWQLLPFRGMAWQLLPSSSSKTTLFNEQCSLLWLSSSQRNILLHSKSSSLPPPASSNLPSQKCWMYVRAVPQDLKVISQETSSWQKTSQQMCHINKNIQQSTGICSSWQ